MGDSATLTATFTIEDLVDELFQIHGIQALRRFLNARDIKLRNDAKLVVPTLEVQMGAEDGKLIAQDLVDFFEEIRIFGKKHIRIFRPTEKQLELLEEYVHKRKFAAVPTEFSEVYPFPIRDRDKLQELGLEPQLTRICNRAAGTILVRCSARQFKRHMQVDPLLLREEAPADFKTAEQIYAVNVVYTQAYDFVLIDLERKIIVLGLDTAIGTPVGGFDWIASQHLNALAKGAKFPLAIMHLEPVDLYPAIAKMYQNKKEGAVVELSFTCATGFHRTEKASLKKAAPDLRNENYHVGGKQALTPKPTAALPFVPYRITIDWNAVPKKQTAFSSTLSINGTRSCCSGNVPIYGAEISEFLFEDEFAFAVDRVLQYV